MADSFLKDALDALGEMAEWRIPAAFADRLARTTNNAEVAAVVRDIIAGVPGILDWPLHLIAQRLQTRGTTASRIAGALLDLIPPLAAEVRQRTGISEADARTETARRFMEKYASIRSTLPTPGGPVADPAPTATTTPTPAPASSVSKIQQNIGRAATEGGFSERERLVLVYMFRILRIEGSPGSDIVAELEGEARSGKRGLLDAIKENSADIKAMFATIGDDFDMAYSSYESMRALERDGEDASTNRAAWREAAKNFVRRLMPVFEFLLMGHAERHPDSTMAAAALDILDRLNMFADLEPSSAFQRAQNIQRTVVSVSRKLLMAFGAILLFFVVAVAVTATWPASLGTIAWWFTVTIVCGSALATIIGAKTERNDIALTGAFTAFGIAPVVLTVAWVLTTVFVTVPDWRAFWMTLIVVVVLDLITFSLAQKAIQTVGGIPSFLLSFFPNKEEAKAAAAKIASTHFLANISSTIAGAVIMLMAPIVITYLLETPVQFRVGTLAVIAVFACIYAYLKRSATMKDYAAYKSKKVMEATEKHDVANVDLAYSGLKVVTIGSLALYVLVAFLGTSTLVEAKDAAAQGVRRTVGIVSDGGDAVLSKAEESTRKGGAKAKVSAPAQKSSTRSSGKTLNCGGEEISATKVAARKKALGGAPRKGTENNYPWNCR